MRRNRYLIGAALLAALTCFAALACSLKVQTAIPPSRSPEWYAAVDSILGISDAEGHGPDLVSDEWRRAVHRRLPDDDSGLTFGDIGTATWFRRVDEVVFWLDRSPPKPDWVYRRNLPEQAWTLEVWEPEGTTLKNRWYRLSVSHRAAMPVTVMRPYDGRVVGQWVTDLNGNGRMEIVLATQSFGTGAYGDVMVYEWGGDGLRKAGRNDWKMPGAGYMGHDVIDLSEKHIIRAFPVYLEGDSNSTPSGGRQLVRYSLKEESLREVDRRSLK